MLICTKCNIEYEEGKKFCRNCGSPLVAKEEPSSSLQDIGQIIEERPKIMRICPRCKVSYESGRYCRKCGSVLVEKVPSQEKEKAISAPQPELKIEPAQIQTPEKRPVEQPEGKLICPNCRIFYESGKFCRKCGSTLVMSTPSQETESRKLITPLPEVKKEAPEIQPLERKSIKGLSREWLKSYEEMKKLEDVIKKLESQRGKVSGDFFSTTFGRYQAQLESISSRLQQVEANLESVKEKTSEEINLLVKELNPIKKRLGEVQSLYKAGAITKADFSKERNELGKEIGSRESTLRKHKQIVALLPSKMGGAIGASLLGPKSAESGRTNDSQTVLRQTPSISKINPLFTAPKGKNFLVVTLAAKNLGSRKGTPIIGVAEVKLDNGHIYGKTGSSVGIGEWPEPGEVAGYYLLFEIPEGRRPVEVTGTIFQMGPQTGELGDRSRFHLSF